MPRNNKECSTAVTIKKTAFVLWWRGVEVIHSSMGKNNRSGNC